MDKPDVSANLGKSQGARRESAEGEGGYLNQRVNTHEDLDEMQITLSSLNLTNKTKLIP